MGKRTKYHREYARKRYKNPEERLKRLKKEREASKKNREKFKEWKKNFKCKICGESEACCLEFHHTNPTKKDFSLSSRSNKKLANVIKEAEKCIVLCSNCHKKHHNGIICAD